MNMSRVGQILGFLSLGVLVVGCGPNVAGDWEYEDNGNGFSDTMTLEEGGQGEREISGYVDANCGDFAGQAKVKLTFEVEWEDKGDEIKLELECADASASLDGCEPLKGCNEVSEVFGFDLKYDGECEINDDGDEIDCEFDGYDDTVTFERD
jgi:hypothetical protein